MANIKDLILSIESADSSFDEKLAAINKMEETLVAMRQQEEQAVQDNVDLIVEAIKLMEKKVTDQLEIAKSIVPEKGDKGDKGDRGADGKSGRDGVDGRDGKDGRDGVDGADGVSVTDAKIDFDGSLVITLSTGREINVGEVVAPDLAEKIKVITTMSTNGAVVIKDEGTTVSGGVKSINFVGASITATNSGDDVTVSVAGSVYDPTNVAITGGNINGTTIGGTTPAAGTFTTLGVTTSVNASGAGSNIDLNVNSKGTGNIVFGVNTKTFTVVGDSANNRVQLRSGGNIGVYGNAGGAVGFYTNDTLQAQVSHTASAVNYVQVTGNTTGNAPIISAQGSDSGVNLNYASKGTFSSHVFTGAQGNQFQITGPADGSNSANRFIAYGGKTGTGLVLGAVGSDTNVSQVFQPRGTGAIDLAAGSSGVNISNGGTVTALTRTAQGSGYTTLPTITISAPTTAGGVQATATPIITILSYVISSGGSGYTVGDTVTLTGGTFTQAWSGTVATVSAGAITSITTVASGSYTVFPSGSAALTGGTGTGATLSTFSGGITSVMTITNAGSGYVEQPTVSFSGGGGSGATAYATVGSGTVVRSLAGTLSFYTPGGEGLRVNDTGATLVNYVQVNGDSSSGNTPGIQSQGTSGVLNLRLSSKSSGSIIFATNSNTNTQFQVSHTASAVNYVQVTGAVTSGTPIISAQGSDANIPLQLRSKGTFNIGLANGAGNQGLVIDMTSGATLANYIAIAPKVAGTSPVISALGSDTNIDLALTPKGTGLVRFGTYTAGAVVQTGYINIKAADGTTYKVLVGT